MWKFSLTSLRLASLRYPDAEQSLPQTSAAIAQLLNLKHLTANGNLINPEDLRNLSSKIESLTFVPSPENVNILGSMISTPGRLPLLRGLTILPTVENLIAVDIRCLEQACGSAGVEVFIERQSCFFMKPQMLA